VTGRGGGISKQLLNDFKKKRRCWKLNEKTLDHTLWRTSLERPWTPRKADHVIVFMMMMMIRFYKLRSIYRRMSVLKWFMVCNRPTRHQSWPNLSCTATYIWGTEQTHKSPNQNGVCASWDSNRAPTERWLQASPLESPSCLYLPVLVYRCKHFGGICYHHIILKMASF